MLRDPVPPARGRAGAPQPADSKGPWSIDGPHASIGHAPAYRALAFAHQRRYFAATSIRHNLHRQPPPDSFITPTVRFFRRKSRALPETASGDSPRTRLLLTGSVTVAGRRWEVREERRQGPRPQILILVDTRSAGCEMHLRPQPGMEATSMEEVERLAAEPAYRWFPDPDGVRWESRIVVPDPPDRLLIKFISWTAGVFEGPYPFENGLGIRTDDELVNLLSQLRVVGD